MPSATSSTVSRIQSRSSSPRSTGDLLVVEHVVVGLLGGVELPGLAGADGVERQLHVVLELGRGLRAAGLVVDQLVAAVGQAVDAVDAAAQQVGPELEGERALEPHRLGRPRTGSARGSGVSAAVAFARQLALLVGVAEAAAPPAGVQQAEQLRASCPAALVEALEHLVDEDPEALVDASAPAGSGRRARTCTSAGTSGRSRCRRPTASGRRRAAGGRPRARARRARRSPARAGGRRARRRAGSRRAPRSRRSRAARR